MSESPALSKFTYITYIRTTPQQLWDALILPEFTRQYWMGITQESDWKPGSPWTIRLYDGRIADEGEIVESNPPNKLVIRWQHQLSAELKAEGWSRSTLEIDPMGDIVKLTVTHTMDVPDSKFIQAVSGGWPMVLSSLKSLLETGNALAHSMGPSEQK
jgi:uncharacterized protein YndB with AHSA1/START domain